MLKTVRIDVQYFGGDTPGPEKVGMRVMRFLDKRETEKFYTYETMVLNLGIQLVVQYRDCVYDRDFDGNPTYRREIGGRLIFQTRSGVEIGAVDNGLGIVLRAINMPEEHEGWHYVIVDSATCGASACQSGITIYQYQQTKEKLSTRSQLPSRRS